jgi:hypothetical protein
MSNEEFLTSEFFSEETREFFKNEFFLIERTLRLEEEYKEYLLKRRRLLEKQALDLGLMTDIQVQFLETETIRELIRDFLFYKE